MRVSVAEWAPKNCIKKVVTLVSDYAPGVDIETFHPRVAGGGGGVAQRGVETRSRHLGHRDVISGGK